MGNSTNQRTCFNPALANDRKAEQFTYSGRRDAVSVAFLQHCCPDFASGRCYRSELSMRTDLEHLTEYAKRDEDAIVLGFRLIRVVADLDPIDVRETQLMQRERFVRLIAVV